jgi:hypothetical protein
MILLRVALPSRGMSSTLGVTGIAEILARVDRFLVPQVENTALFSHLLAQIRQRQKISLVKQSDKIGKKHNLIVLSH